MHVAEVETLQLGALLIQPEGAVNLRKLLALGRWLERDAHELFVAATGRNELKAVIGHEGRRKEDLDSGRVICRRVRAIRDDKSRSMETVRGHDAPRL